MNTRAKYMEEEPGATRDWKKAPADGNAGADSFAWSSRANHHAEGRPNALRRFWRKWRNPRQLLSICARALMRPIFSSTKFFFVGMDTSCSPPIVRKRMKNLVFRELSEDETARLDYASTPNCRRVFRQYFTDGAVCYGMLLEGRVAAHVFACARNFPERGYGLVVPVARDETYLFGMETDRRQRGRGIAIELILKVKELSARNGIRRLIGLIDSSKGTACRNWRRIGFRPTCMLKHVRLLGGCLKTNRYFEWDKGKYPF